MQIEISKTDIQVQTTRVEVTLTIRKEKREIFEKYSVEIGNPKKTESLTKRADIRTYRSSEFFLLFNCG
ncbi:MAG: hypothetical protein ACRDDF_07135, partial [Aeromonas sp.]